MDEKTIKTVEEYVYKNYKSYEGKQLIIAGEAGNIYYSLDHGRQWDLLPSPYRGSFFTVAAQDTQTMVIAGLRGHLFKSNDGGQNWKQLSVNTQAILTDIILTADNDFIVVGLDGAVIVNRTGYETEYYSQKDRKGMTAITSNSIGELFVVGEGGLKKLELSSNYQGEGS